MTETTIRWGIIGCGDVTERKSGPAYRITEGFELIAVMRRDAAKAKDYALRHGVAKWYADADALIADPEVDAVYIATPPDSHRYYALRVAEAGKPCCIEKPMAPSYAECLEIVEAFEKKGIPLFVAYYRRSLPRFRKIGEWLSEGKVGAVRHVSWLLTRTPSDTDRSGAYNWRTDGAIAPAGYFDDLACHGLDLFRFLFGEMEAVRGISHNQQRLYTAADAVTAVWRHEGGATGSGIWNFGSDLRQDEVVIYGSEGRIGFSMFGEQPIWYENASGRHELAIPHPVHIQQFHVQAMRDHLLGVSVHPSTGKSAAETAWMMDRILGKIQ